ncbi:YebO family protein [Kluyvera genomosp. 1]|uniref:YebO family protein n=1 Tax=Kluyvera genomosp. 1 TaxID=2774053 RepID=UPI00068CAFB5|nr:YebO family protein [Kluyvera genomosp. 1]
MSDLVSSGALNLASLAFSFLLLLVGLVLWFFVNRTSSRANEQIELLESLLDQQKRQNALLRRLCEIHEPEKKEEDAPKTQAAVEDNDEDDFIRLVAER